ncbi:hypothetical protein BH20GEM2_BH20GEM2_19780 [soil metagenome]
MKKWLKWGAIAVVGIGALFLFGRFAGGYIPRFTRWVDGLGAWGPVVFVVGYALATVFFIPGALMTLAAGAIFGLVEGTLYTIVAATLGACAAFLVSRYLARDSVERRLAVDERFEKVDKAIRGEGLKVIFLLRLSPIFPFVFLNYALGLTAVRFRDYAFACLGMLPGTLLYVYYGKAAGEAAALAGGADVERGTEYYVFLGVGLLATVIATWIVTRTARRALERQTELADGEDSNHADDADDSEDSDENRNAAD